MSPPRGGFDPDDPNQQIVAEDIFDEYGGITSSLKHEEHPRWLCLCLDKHIPSNPFGLEWILIYFHLNLSQYIWIGGD